MTFYSVVTFGTPAIRRTRFATTLEAAVSNAHSCFGTGTCSGVQVIASPTRAMAAKADISRTLPGQSIVFSR